MNSNIIKWSLQSNDHFYCYNGGMKYLRVHFDSLDGYYTFVVLDDHTYTIDTNIEGFVCQSGTLNNYDEFENKLSKANILSWDKKYNPDGLEIEDDVKWNVTLDDFLTSGVEGYWPYHYDDLIEAIMLVDNKAAYFKANLGEQ